MPNPDGSMTDAERKAALLTTAAPLAGTAGSGTSFDPSAPANAGKGAAIAQIANGQRIGGSEALNPGLNTQNALFGNLTGGEALAKQQGDFGLGSNNNAQTAAMLGNAGATADKYSDQFGTDAVKAGALSNAVGQRGLSAYQGNTQPYSDALTTAASDRSMQTGAYDQLMDFSANHIGPSAAQAQLTQSTDANTQNALALARSGRGMGGGQAALRTAIGQNATTQQSSNAQAAELRANENTAYQAQRLSAINSAGSLASQTVASDQGLATTGLAGAQYQSDTALKGTQLNDASAQAWAAQQQAAQQQGLGAEVGGQTQQLNVDSTALAGRESEWADANQTLGIEKGAATQAGIADANRQQAYVGAGLSGAGMVIGAVSDENAKTNIQPLSAASTVQPLNSQAPPSPTADVSAGPSIRDAQAAQRSATGAAVGGTAGSIAGGAIGSLAGPVGTAVGSVVGNIAGKALGKVFSDVRNKTNVQPLSAGARTGAIMGTVGSQLAGGKGDPYAELIAKYGAAGKQPASSASDVDEYAKARVPTARFPDVTGTSQGIFSRSTDHPILSKGDALLADSARNAPGSLYEYKDPNDGPGVYAGPMAQDLAAHPVTQGAVGQDPSTGKLVLDGTRLAAVNTAQNHSQQNQIDTLDDKISSLTAMLDQSKKRQQASYRGGLDSMGNQFMGAQ